jgi:hypothetical protein
MRPLLREGDSVLVQPLTPPPDAGTPPARPGDLILLIQNEIPVVHRYAGRRGGVDYQRSDHGRVERPVRAEDVLGLVRRRRRRGRERRLRRPLRWRLRTLLRGMATP